MGQLALAWQKQIGRRQRAVERPLRYAKLAGPEGYLRLALIVSFVPSLSMTDFSAPPVGMVKWTSWLKELSVGHCSFLPPTVTAVAARGAWPWKLNWTSASPLFTTTAAKRIFT